MRTIYESTVCVTGGCGFLGSHLVKYLTEERKCKVVVIDNLVSGHRKFLHRDAEFVHLDITGPEDDILRLFKRYGVEYVFQYAASPYIPVSFERPLYVFNINAFGALKVINAAQDAGCKGILQVSSAEIYGNQSGKINEHSVVEPHSSYGASKAAIDFIVQARWRERQTPVLALRQFNCVGENETHPYVIPEIVGQLIRSYKVPECPLRLGNNSSRDFLYAGDAVRIAVELLERGEFGHVYNLGSEDCVQIYQLARMIGNVIGCGNLVIELDEKKVRPWEIWRLQSDNSKIYRTVEARPEVGLMDALHMVVEDFRRNGCRWVWEKS